jgi:DNA helicase-2/ATP-dependent DNA helicase PcrA
MSREDFLSERRSLMIAPAGHGKTHYIAECIKECNDCGCQLILTHTHAGVASLKEKLWGMGVSPKSYEVQTICGFALYLVTSFGSEPITEEENYFEAILHKSTALLDRHSIRNVMGYTYKGLFVDEYQDCTKTQHALILKIAELMPTHLFGDPLQAIFDFNGEVVDFENDLNEFKCFDELKTPWRWQINGNNQLLGQYILNVRNQLLNKSHKTVSDHEVYGVYVHKVPNPDAIRQIIRSIEGESVLIIIPSWEKGKAVHGLINERVKWRKKLGLYDFQLLEAMSGGYNAGIVNDLDNLPKKKNKVKAIKGYLTTHFQLDAQAIEERMDTPTRERMEEYQRTHKMEDLRHILGFFFQENKWEIHRPALAQRILASIDLSISDGQTIQSHMENFKKGLWYTHRKVQGKCIGTTLLTKGLEFDTVVILGANHFKDIHNFYVAISRACKQLHYIVKKERT